MELHIDHIPPSVPTSTESTLSSTLIIDNGTHTLKAGFQHSPNPSFPQLTFRNRIYKHKDTFTYSNTPSSTQKTMFEKDIIINIETLEATIDIIYTSLLQNTNENQPSSKNKAKPKILHNSQSCMEPENSAHKIDNLILTIAFDTPDYYKSQILSLLFDVYNFKKVQLGVDLYYAYLWNIKDDERSGYNEHDLIISVSYNSLCVFLVTNDKIIKRMKMGLGGQILCEYFMALINNKYGDISFKVGVKEAEYLLQYAYAAMDYGEDSLLVYEKLKSGLVQFVVMSNFIKYHVEDDSHAVKKKVKRIKIQSKGNKKVLNEEEQTTDAEYKEEENASNDAEEEENTKDIKNKNNLDLTNKTNYHTDSENKIQSDYDLMTETKVDVNEELQDNPKSEDNNYNDELDEDNRINEEEIIKEQRRQKMIYYSSMFRFKQKIEKQLKKLKINIEHLEEDLEKTLDIDKYLEKIRSRYTHLKREIKLRNITRKEMKNNKSVEFLIMMKVSNGFSLILPEEKIYNKIKEANDDELAKLLEEDLEKYRKILAEMDPEYLYDKTPYNILRGDHINLNGLCVDLELMKITEILFEPSIIGLSQPGLKDFFEEIRGVKLKNVLLTGGLANIKNLDKRIELELTQNSLHGNVKVRKAQHPEFDAFRGAHICDAFPTYTREEYEIYGAEELIKKYSK